MDPPGTPDGRQVRDREASASRRERLDRGPGAGPAKRVDTDGGVVDTTAPSVLVVDDGSDAVDATVDAMEETGLTVHRVEGAVGALGRLDETTVDCVVCPTVVDRMRGIELFHRLRSDHPEIAFVLLVRGDEGDAINRARTAGVEVLSTATDDYEAVAEGVRALAFDRQTEAARTRDARLRRAIQGITRSLLESPDRGTIERTVTERLVETGGYPVAWMSRRDPDTDELVPRTAFGLDPEALARRPIGDVLTGDREEGVIVKESGVAEGGYGIVVPLVAHERVLGTLHLSSPSAVDATELRRLADLGEAVSTAIAGVAPAEPAPERPDLDLFSRTLEHELRNHLAIAQSHLQLGREGGGDEYFDRVAAALERIQRLADQAAVVARREIPVQDMSSRDLADIVEPAWGNVETDDAELVVESTMPVFGRQTVLELLFENLFRNAVEHAGPTVTVRVGTIEDGFYVEDDGPGIPEDDRERIFDWAYTSGTEDRGIGLALVKSIVEAHDWEIEATESEDGGARFEVRGVPRQEADAVERTH